MSSGLVHGHAFIGDNSFMIQRCVIYKIDDQIKETVVNQYIHTVDGGKRRVNPLYKLFVILFCYRVFFNISWSSYC